MADVKREGSRETRDGIDVCRLSDVCSAVVYRRQTKDGRMPHAHCIANSLSENCRLYQRHCQVAWVVCSNLSPPDCLLLASPQSSPLQSGVIVSLDRFCTASPSIGWLCGLQSPSQLYEQCSGRFLSLILIHHTSPFAGLAVPSLAVFPSPTIVSCISITCHVFRLSRLQSRSAFSYSPEDRVECVVRCHARVLSPVRRSCSVQCAVCSVPAQRGRT